jgi:hypothetical protein
MSIDKGGMREIAYETLSDKDEILDPKFKKEIILQWEGERPNPIDFCDLDDKKYKKSRVTQDLLELKEKMKNFEKSILGDIGEAVIMEGFGMKDWLPGVEEVLVTSNFDDVNRGVDIVFRLKFGDKPPAYLGVDVKTTNDQGEISKRQRRIDTDNNSGKFNTLKYFKDDNNGHFGELKLINIVLTIDPRYAIIMQNIMIKKDPLDNKERSKEELIKNTTIIEIISQLMATERYFETQGLDNPSQKKVQSKYQEIIDIILNNIDMKGLIDYLDKLIALIESIGKEAPDLVRIYKKYKIIFDDYKENREVNY